MFDGDGPATSHALDPAGIALDSHGNLYISDETNNRVRKLDSGGNMATVAGNGSASFSGDGGPATSASLYAPQGVAVDGAGNLYIMDTANLRVRKVDTNGNISTVAGTGNTQGCTVGSGPALHVDVCGEWVAADAAGNLYVDYTNEYMVSKIDTAGNIAPFAGGSGFQDSANGALATQEMLFEPKFLATDANGIVYFAGVQSSVRKIATDGTVTEAVPSQSVSAVDGMGNLYWANGPSNEVVEVDASGAATTVAGTGQPGTCIFNGDGAATTHNVCDPSGAAVDSSGSLFIADTNNCRVRKVDSTGNMTTVAGNGSCTYNGDGAATAFSLNLPAAVAVDPAGNVFVADTANNRVREISTDGTMTTIGGNGMLLNGQCAFDGDGPATQHSVCSPNSIAVGPSGNVFVLDSGNVRVRMISDGNMTTLAGNGQSGFTGENDPASTAILDHPAAIASDPSGNIYIADQFNNRIRKISQISTFIVSAGQPMVTLKAGGSGAVTLQVTAANGFSGTVSFSCSGAPEGATCTPSPGSVSISGGSASTTFTVTTTAASAIARVFHSWAGTLGMWWWVFAFVIVAAIVSRPKRRIAFAFAMAALTLMPACGGSTPPGGGGGGGGVSPTPKGSYTLTLTTVAGSTTQTTTVKLNVQ